MEEQSSQDSTAVKGGAWAAAEHRVIVQEFIPELLFIITYRYNNPRNPGFSEPVP